jgi:hypothetical protein
MKSPSVCAAKYNLRQIIDTIRAAPVVTVAVFEPSVKEYEHWKAIDTRREAA